MFGYRQELASAHVNDARAWISMRGEEPDVDRAAPGIVGAKAAPDRPVVLHDVCKKVIGDYIPSQNQPRGTCTSRGLKRDLDVMQCVMIGAGAPLVFKQTNHAIIYGLGREIAGMLGGNPNNENDDGCTGAAVGRGAVQGGELTYEDTTEPGDNENSDTLACQYGARGVPTEYKAKAKNHLVKNMAQVKTTDQGRDLIVNGYGFTVASNVGFMGIRSSRSVMFTRDSNGRAHRGGTWSHQMTVQGWTPDLAGDGECFLVDQSWGPGEPDGPIGPIPIPSYSFWILKKDLAAMLAQDDSWTFSGFDGWPADLIHWLI